MPAGGEYRLSRIHPDDFLWDSNAGPLMDDWSWCAQRVVTTMKELKKDPSISKKALKTIGSKSRNITDDEQRLREQRKKGDMTSRMDMREYDSLGYKEPELVTLWEIYDLKNKQWLKIAEGSEADDFSGGEG